MSCRLDILVIRRACKSRMTWSVDMVCNILRTCEGSLLYPPSRAINAIPTMHLDKDNLLNGAANQVYAIACTTGQPLRTTVQRATPTMGQDCGEGHARAHQ
jgi:hypothetical protein